MPDHSSNNIKWLLLKVADGDEYAFGQLFKIFYNQLGDFILRITESEQLTQEIVQDVFLKIWINRSSVGQLDCFKAYLLVVARNHAFNCLKKIASEKIREKQWVNTVLHEAANNVQDTVTTDTNKLIDEAVELLPPQQQKVYILSRIENMKQEEIARELNISLETVKKHMVLALRFLKNYLRTNLSFFMFSIAVLFKA